MEKACQTTVDEFNYSLNSQKTYVHHSICQQGYTAIEKIKSKISDLQSSVDSFETSLGDLDSILFSYNKAADLNEKYLAKITEYKNHISCLKQQLTTVKEERDSLQLAVSLVVKEPKRYNSNPYDGSKPVSSCQITNKHITKPPKNEMACPFLRRRGFCLKGANCDFLHPLNSQLSAQEKRVPSFVPTHPFVSPA